MNEVIPERIGRYVVRGVAGRGAMGVILRAHDPELDRDVAVKLVATSLLAGADASDYLDRFRREARAAGRCAHSGIVAVHDFGVQDGQPYLAMEYVDGTSLQAEIAAGRRFSPEEAVAIAVQVLDALGCAHAAGVVHRDVKPANILLLPGLRVKVTDFGIARVADSDLTRAGDMIGTPSYMSPEACLGRTVEARSDLFSAGVVLHELLSGGRTFAGGGMLEVVRRVIEAPPPALPAAIAEAYPALPAVVLRALAKAPEDRFADASAMAAALRSGVQDGRAPAGDDPTMVAAPAASRPGFGARPNHSSDSASGLALAPDDVSRLERLLAEHVGPIAGMLVRSAVRRHGTRQDGLEALLAHVGDAEGRERLRQAWPGAGQVAEADASAPPVAAPPQELARIRAALAPVVGPIAGMIVKREAAGGAGAEELWRRVAVHIDDPRERAAFLARRNG
ncbi:serine/threonine-protein kinase [Roseomonas sp. CCTCC AB2023176]|uniref:serine/threonine-protein kinase n=1 Tax=Roseomonas sp. CCTCC AB2023176 TaxID=3342640 RepID=UPI0035D72745